MPWKRCEASNKKQKGEPLDVVLSPFSQNIFCLLLLSSIIYTFLKQAKIRHCTNLANQPNNGDITNEIDEKIKRLD